MVQPIKSSELRVQPTLAGLPIAERSARAAGTVGGGSARDVARGGRDVSRTWSVVIHPYFGPPEGLDVTGALIDAVARELQTRYGGNEQLNRLEAERLLEDAI
jgi:hypothetical protein